MAALNLNKSKIIGDLITFTDSSMKWCNAESEKASLQVTSILDLLLKDAARMSAMSASTLKAVEQLRNHIGQLSQEDAESGHDAMVRQISKLCSESTELESVVMPIVEALQFQDRIRQVMENLVKMFHVWQKEREHLLNQTNLSESEWETFGTKLSKCATMSEERTVLRSVIKQVPEEKKVEDMMLF